MMDFRFFILWSIAGALEFPFAKSFFLGSTGYEGKGIWLLAIHATASVIAFYSIPKKPEVFKGQILWPATFGFLVFVLPFFGWVLCATFFLILRKNRPPLINTEEVDFFGFVETSNELVLRISHARHQERVYQEIDFEPLADILEGNDLQLKRGAIEKLAEWKSPEAVQALYRHRGDSSADVRFYVTSALSRMKKEYDEEIDAAKHDMEKDSTDEAKRLNLAQVYIRYALSGLLDDITATAYKKEAIYHLETAFERKAIPPSGIDLLVGLLTEAGESEKALKYLSEIEQKSGQVPLAKLKLLFETGNYQQLSQDFGALPTNSPPEWEALSRWWRGK